MPLGEDFDVVVIGFGVAGAWAAAEATGAGARVLVLDRRGVVATRGPVRGAVARAASGELPHFLSRRLGWAARRPIPARVAARAAALAAGVTVRTQTVVHELLVEGGQVIGVGCATMDPRTPSGARYWWLDQLSHWTPRLSRTLSSVVTRAAESLWQEASSVDEVRCSAVVLGMGRSHWDFVGPAVWAGQVGTTAAEPPSRRLGLVSPGAANPASPTPELAARSWCAAQEPRPSVAGCLSELRVDRTSGAVSTGEAAALPGLYAAVPDALGRAGSHEHVTLRAIAAGRRAGRAAATIAHRVVHRHLRSVV
jgi:hypothetical protein